MENKILDKEIAVTNRYSGTAGYTLPELGGLHRHFQAGETKIVPFREIRALSYTVGGDNMLRDIFKITDKEVLKELGLKPQMEYFYDKEQVLNLMKNGSDEAFLDCLDFAPEGVIEMIKDLAVDIKLNSMSKRKAILDKTGFDVTHSIELKEISETKKDKKTVKPSRRVGKQEEPKVLGRRVTTKEA